MSGDVQPKKRKDKKRRKDDGEQVPIQTHVPLLTTNVINDDVNIHVHKESGTGGGICAKLVFFVLFSALAVLIGLIITEHRGLTDLDSVDTDSKYSQIFEGWVDTNAAHHDNSHDVEEHVEPQGEHELEHEDDYDHEEEENIDDSEDEEHEQEIEPSKEDGESADEEDEEGSKFSDEESNEEEQEDENDNDEDDYDNSVDESDEREVDEEEENDSFQASEEENNQDNRNYENENYSEEKEVDDEDQDIDSDEENNKNEEENEDDDKDFIELKYVEENDDGEDEEPHKEDDQDPNNMQSEEKHDVSIEEKREIVQKEKSTLNRGSREIEEEQESDGYTQESAGVAVKLGVGVALLVVAYLVLVKKWRTAPEDKRTTESLDEPTPDLSRRNTIVVPPSFQEVEPDIEQDDEDYSEDEDMSDYDRDMEPKSAKTKYQELKSKYSRSFTPDEDNDDILNENDYDDNIDKEEEEISEVEEEEEEEDSKNEEYDDDEDEELLKRLEAKYGKLQDEKSHSKNTTSWKHINFPPNTNEETDSDRESDDSTGYENINITNKDDYHIKKELDESQKHIENE